MFDFSFWNALACYFEDPAGSIVELIAHRGLEENGRSGPFSGDELLGLSEVGLVGDVPAMARALEELDLRVWSGSADDPEGLAFVGEKARTLDPVPGGARLAADRPPGRAPSGGRHTLGHPRGNRRRQRPPRHAPMRRIGSILLAVGVVTLAVVYGLLGIVLGALRCDESCEDPPEVWRDDPSAWQWDALAAFGLAAVAASVVFLVAVALGRRYLGWIALVATSLAVTGFVAIESASGLGILGLVAVALIGGGAIALLPGRERPISAA